MMSDSDEESSSQSTYQSSHASRDQTMPEAVKRRVDRATCSNPELTGTRCLIENTEESNAVEYAYCLPRSTQGRMLDSLEYSWNMPRFTLNVDTRHNVIRLSPKFRKLFDSELWVLLPEPSIIDIYYNARHESLFPVIDQPIYKYTLVPHSDMRRVPIRRQKSFPVGPDTPPVDFTHYSYPYHDFPTIVSHVHPRFVICKTARKMEHNFNAWCKQSMRKQDMEKIFDIWLGWIYPVKARGGRDFYKSITVNVDPNISDDDGQRTVCHRAFHPRLKRRQAPERGSAIAQRSSKRRKVGDSDLWLDDEVLLEFNQQTCSPATGADRKKQLILDWLSDILVEGGEIGLKENQG